ncbi:MAG: 1-acyl-sn-glycerol-3-phosphate acyltransferase [Nitrospirae bacterium]|nr:1-acyl-sn-glycerol-3-phosphate acyltransferase [Nitrospirota bacterium]
MRALFRGLGIIPLLLVYFFITGIIGLLPVDRKTKRVVAIRIASRIARIILILFGVRVHVKHRERLHKTGDGRLIVSNHLSYIDILVLSALAPSVFITSVELKNTALLGTLARLSGSIFVERRRPSGLKREIEDIAVALGQGLPVALFPEGTTSNGDRVQPFKNSLFDAAVLTRADIVPICIRYTRVNNERLTPENRDLVFYYGGATFLKHFLRFLSLRSIELEVIPLKAIKVHSLQSRKDLAAETYEAINAVYYG